MALFFIKEKTLSLDALVSLHDVIFIAVIMQIKLARLLKAQSTNSVFNNTYKILCYF